MPRAMIHHCCTGCGQHMMSPVAGSTSKFIRLIVTLKSSSKVGVNPVFAEHHCLKSAAVEFIQDVVDTKS